MSWGLVIPAPPSWEVVPLRWCVNRMEFEVWLSLLRRKLTACINIEL